MRLDKFLAHNGFGSRSDVKKIIKQKRVRIHEDIILDPKFKVDLKQDLVYVDDFLIEYKEQVIYMLNKPQGFVSAHSHTLYPSVLELIPSLRQDLKMVGRLDVDTEGLLLITNDGQLIHKIAHGQKNIEKEYEVTLEYPFDESYIPMIEKGLKIKDTQFKPAKIKIFEPHLIYLTIQEGKYHQVKNMMIASNNNVTHLKRIRIGNLLLDDTLNLGESRLLTPQELDLLLKEIDKHE